MGFDCVQWVNLFKTKVMLCGLKNTCYTEVTWAFKKILLIFNIRFTKIKSLEIKHSIVRSCLCTIRGINWFDCQMRSNSIPGLSFIEFDWVQLKLFHRAPMTMYKLLNVLKIESLDLISCFTGQCKTVDWG